MKNIRFSAILTTIIFVLLFVVNALPINSDFLDPLQQAFKDFELTDIVYSQLLDEAPKRIDTNIVIVNIGALGRRDIAKVISRVMSIQPKFAALDAMFLRDTDSSETMELVRCLNRYDNFIMAEQLLSNDQTTPTVLHGLVNDSLKSKEEGYVNFPSAIGSYRTVRSVTPFQEINGQLHSAFAVKIAEKVSLADVAYLRDRDNSVETINYQKLNTFVRVDFNQVLDTTISIDFITGKIVLFGYLGERLNDVNSYEDRYFTPVNKRYAGKSLPDMFGVEIHANILSMILHRDYVNSMSGGMNIVLSWIFCFLVIILFGIINSKLPHYYDLVSKSLQIFTILFLLFAVIVCFDFFRYRFDSSLAALTLALAADGFQILSSALSARNYSKNKKNTRAGASPELPQQEPLKHVQLSRRKKKR